MNRRRIAPTGEEGAAAVEFAFVGLLFFMLVFAIITFGLVLAANHTLSHAAAEGARAALVAGSDPATVEGAARDTTLARMSWLGDGGTAQAFYEGCEEDPTRTCIRVVTTYDNATHPLVPLLPGFGIVIPDQMSRTAVVQLTQT